MTYSAEVLADSPLIYWRLGETVGTTAADTSGNGHTGTFVNAPSLGVTGLLVGDANKAAGFTSAGDSGVNGADTPVAIGTLGAFTIEAIVRETADLVGGSNIFGLFDPLFSAPDWIALQYSTGIIGFPTRKVLEFSYQGVTFPKLYKTRVDAHTYHLMGTYDGTTMTFYVNGVVADSLTISDDAIQTVANSFAAGNVQTGGWATDGTVDECAFYLTALSSGRAAAHFAASGIVDTSIESTIKPVLRTAQTGRLWTHLASEILGQERTVSPVRRTAQAGRIFSALASRGGGGGGGGGSGGGGQTGGGTPTISAVTPDITCELVRLDAFDTVRTQFPAGRSRQWIDTFNETGSGGLTLQLDDTDIGLLGMDANDLVRFYYKGVGALTMIVEGYQWTQIGADEEAGMAVVLNGRGHLALLERALVYPSRGVNPDAFSWYLLDYNDDTWPGANVITVDAGSFIAGGTFPVGGADAIWGYPGDNTWAPPGPCWFRQHFTTGAENINIAVACDDFGSAYLDGVLVADIPQANVGYGLVIQLNNIPVAAGAHVLAIEVTNRIDGRPPPGNTAGVVASVQHSAGGGVIAFTDSATKVRSYPQHTPVFPIEDDRSFTWTSFGFDDSGWGPAHKICTVADAKIFWVPPWAHDWPDDGIGCDVLWAPSGSISNAPEGDCYFRKLINVPASGKYLLYALADNSCEVYIDGAQAMSIAPTFNSFTTVTSAAINLDEGIHLVAIHGNNSFDYGAPGNNPGGVAFVMYSTDVDGSTPLSVISESGEDWLQVSYPAEPPGMTPGRVIRMVLEEAQARRALLGISLGFSDTADSAGTPWPVVGDIATKAGNDMLTFIRELSATYIDVHMRPGSLVLDAWVAGTRGASSGVAFHGVTDPTDPLSGNLTGLIYKGST